MAISNTLAYSLCVSVSFCVCGLHASVHACVQTVMVAPSENRWVFLSILLHTLPLTLQGRSITAHNKHPVLAVRPRKWVFIVIGPVSLTGSRGCGTSQNEECGPNFMFPIFDCSLNKWVKGRRGKTQASRLRRISFFLPLHTWTPNRDSHAQTHGKRTSDNLKWNLNVCLPPS